MKTSFISTLTLWNSPRTGVARMQSDLADATQELNGRYADTGLQLGYRTGTTLDLRQESNELDAQQARNSLTNLRLTNKQTSLDQVRKDGEDLLALVVPGKLSDDSATVVMQEAASRLKSFASDLNASAGGQYLFAGIDTQTRPVADYETTPGSDAKNAVKTAFTAAFGFAQGDQPGSAAITADQMKAFLDGPFTALFSDAQWSSSWSSASNRNISSEIARGQTVETSANANAVPLRQLAMAYVAGADLGLSALSKGAQAVVYAKMRDLLGSGTAGTAGMQSELGRVQAKVASATTGLDAQKLVMTKALQGFEYVDPAEANSRINQLQAQIQMSYSITAQIRKLSLINFI
jgi:flagellar hook-associated protein 3 FlgL